MSGRLIRRGWSVGTARKAMVVFGATGMTLLIATIFTTNLPDTYSGEGGKPLDSDGAWKQAIEQYKYKRTLEEHIGSRARSRLFEMCKVIEMDGPDYRRIIATQRAGMR